MFQFDKAQWATLSPLLDRALDLDARDRDALVADVARQEPELARVLARLLIEHERLAASGFLETSLTLALWRRWNETHANNPFVRRRLAAIDAAAGGEIR